MVLMYLVVGRGDHFAAVLLDGADEVLVQCLIVTGVQVSEDSDLGPGLALPGDRCEPVDHALDDIHLGQVVEEGILEQDQALFLDPVGHARHDLVGPDPASQPPQHAAEHVAEIAVERGPEGDVDQREVAGIDAGLFETSPIAGYGALDRLGIHADVARDGRSRNPQQGLFRVQVPAAHLVDEGLRDDVQRDALARVARERLGDSVGVFADEPCVDARIREVGDEQLAGQMVPAGEQESLALEVPRQGGHHRLRERGDLRDGFGGPLVITEGAHRRLDPGLVAHRGFMIIQL